MNDELKPYSEPPKTNWFGSPGPDNRIYALIVILAAALLALWAADRLFLFFLSATYVEKIARVFNLDDNMARAISFVIWVLVIFFVSKLFALSKRSRLTGFLGLVSLLVVHSLLLSFGGRGHFFDASSGKPTKCYVLTRDGEVKYLERPGVDPVTGRVCRIYTQETAERLQSYAQGRRPERILVPRPVFFDPRSGEPIAWFWKGNDGHVELFDFMGFHPENGEELLPVNAEIAAAYMDQAQRNISPPQPVDIERYERFDPSTGHPRVWFWRGANGKYEFYDNPGYNPSNGEPLKIFDKSAIDRWENEKRLAKEYQEQEEKKRRDEEVVRKDNEARKAEREREAAERAQRDEEEKQQRKLEAVNRCDQLAANPHDPKKPQNILGARFSEVESNAGEAVSVCRVAMDVYPDEPRYRYQYARALGFSKPEQAIAIYRALTKEVYPAAFDNLASLLLQRKDRKSIREAVLVLRDGVKHGDPDSMVTLAALVGTTEFPVQNPYSYKLMLLRQAANLGNDDAKQAADELEQQLQQQQQEYLDRRQQEQMMIQIFGTILGGIPRPR